MAPLIVLVVVAFLARLIGQLGVIQLRGWAASTPGERSLTEGWAMGWP